MNFSIEFDEVKNAVSKLQESADKMQDFRARLHEAALECVILSGGGIRALFLHLRTRAIGRKITALSLRIMLKFWTWQY